MFIKILQRIELMLHLHVSTVGNPTKNIIINVKALPENKQVPKIMF